MDIQTHLTSVAKVAISPRLADAPSGYCPLVHPARLLPRALDGYSHVIKANDTVLYAHAPTGAAPQWPRRVNLPLRQGLCLRHVSGQMGGHAQMMLNDKQGIFFWRDFLQHNRRITENIFGPFNADDILHLNVNRVRRLQSLLHKVETCGQYVYWLLQSEAGPGSMVAFSPETGEALVDWLEDIGVQYSRPMLDQSRYKKLLAQQDPGALAQEASLAEPQHVALVRRKKHLDLTALSHPIDT